MPNDVVMMKMAEDIGYIKSSVGTLVESSHNHGKRLESIESRIGKVESKQGLIKMLLTAPLLPISLFLKFWKQA